MFKKERIKKSVVVSGCTVLAVCCFALSVIAEPVAYPAKGQSPEQQAQDQQQCRQWAVQQSGVDPARLSAPQSTAQPRERKVLKGAVAGAAIGGLGGSLGGEFGKGAGAGAVAGAVVGGVRQRRDRNNAESVQQQTQQQQQQLVEQFNRAYGACLEGRGYTVK